MADTLEPRPDRSGADPRARRAPEVDGEQRPPAAERVAAAAEAWLADPRDVRVYGRLVAAVAEWRAAGQVPADIGRVGPAGPVGHGAPGGDTDPDPDLDPDEATGEQRASSPDRQPQRLDGILGSVAAELRARGITTLPADG